MSMTHAWWPKSAGTLIAEALAGGALSAVPAWAGAARPRMAAVNPLVTAAANPNLFIVMLLLLSWLTGRSWAGGLSERHIPKAVGGVGFVVFVHVVTGHIRARRIGAIRHERIGVGAGDGRQSNRSTDRGCGQPRRDMLE